MLTLKKTFSMLAIAALTLVACTPEDGETGPAGPIGPEGQIGPAGDTGADGQDGVDGQDGKDGVANITTQTITVPSASWTGGGTKVFGVEILEIDQAVVDNGTVQVFHTETPATPSWDALPYGYLVGIAGGVEQITIQYSYKTDSLNLSVINTGGFNITGSPTFPGDRTFKVVIIPPAVKVAGVDHSDYKAVEMVYGLEK